MYRLVDSVDYLESKKLIVTLILNILSGYENRTGQTGRVISDLYTPNSFYTSLCEQASANFLP